MKPFLILQLRPEDEAADDEFSAFLKFGRLKLTEAKRIRMEKVGVPVINLSQFSGIIMGGGPYNVSDLEKPAEQKKFEAELKPIFDEILEKDVPFLGACYGIGALTSHLGGDVSKDKYAEGVGATTIELTSDAKTDSLTKDLPSSFKAFGGHKEACQKAPKEAVILGTSANCPIQIIRVKKNVYATQFHTELDRNGLEVRINIYRHAGYFPPEDADMLISAAKKEEVTVPEIILRRFVQKYRAFS